MGFHVGFHAHPALEYFSTYFTRRWCFGMGCVDVVPQRQLSFIIFSTLRTCAAAFAPIFLGLFTKVLSLTEVSDHFGAFGALLPLFMDNLIMSYLALFTVEFHITSAILFELLQPFVRIMDFIDNRVQVSFNVKVKLPFVCEYRPTMLTCPWLAVIVYLPHVFSHRRPWITFSTIFTRDLF